MKFSPKYLLPSAEMLKPSVLPYRGVQFVGSSRYAHYLVVSAISLGADLSAFYLMLQIKMLAVQASVLGYVLGLVVHWFLSSRLVFAEKTPSSPHLRRRQKLLFAITAIMGLVVTAAVVRWGIQMGLEPGLSKLAAIFFSFHLTYVCRRTFVFR